MDVVTIDVAFVICINQKKFSIKSLDEIYKDIDTVSSYYPNTIKVFLADGDALTLDTKYLIYEEYQPMQVLKIFSLNQLKN